MSSMSTKTKVFLGFGVYILITIIIVAATGWHRTSNDAFQPQNEFKLDTYFSIGPFDVNKAVLYVLAAAILTCATMIWVSRRMQAKPNRVQTAVEIVFNLMRDNITRGSMDDRMAAKWFPFIATLFFFIAFSNLIGYLPLPTNSAETINIFGLEIPALSIYAATANISFPLILTLVVWITYHVEGVRSHGLFGFLKSYLPAGLENMNPIGKGLIYVIELLSDFMRLVSLSVRLFANLLAGHLLLLFMGGGLAVLLGIAALGALTFPLAFVFFVLEVGLIATLQAFIFATLSAIYIGGAIAESH